MNDLIQLQPFDAYNQTLQANVHPTDWKNPTPRGRYNLVVVGAGTAGLVTAAGAAGLGASVALIERELMGGDCLNVGCVPSKGVISAARVAATVRDAERYGIKLDRDFHIDFSAVMERMRRLRAGISRHDSAKRFSDLGIDVYLGAGSFTSRNTIDVGGTILSFKKAVIATGARAGDLPIPGLRETGYLTNESVFSLTRLPDRMAVIGGGPIGSEMAQAFARLGSQVTQIENAKHILPREDSDAARIVQASLERDGVSHQLQSRLTRVERRENERIVFFRNDGREHSTVVDQILVAVGRTPNVDHLGLEAAGVAYDVRKGVEVNDRLQTTNPRIFAAGDVCSRFKFTHAADFMARIVLRNALFLGRAKVSALTIPWCTYTSPELAHVGMSPRQAKEMRVETDTFTQELSGVDRATLDGETDGFVRVHVRRGSDEIVGATIVAANAGDMIGEICLSMTHGLGLKKIADAIHPYPTQAEAIRKVGDLYNRTRLTPRVKSLFKRWLAWNR